MHDRVGPAIIAGRAPAAVVRRVALEDYHAARWVAPELALLVANAPDAYAFTIDHTRHYRHWAERFAGLTGFGDGAGRSEEHTSELQSQSNLVCRLLLEKKKTTIHVTNTPTSIPDSYSIAKLPYYRSARELVTHLALLRASVAQCPSPSLSRSYHSTCSC